MLISNFIAYLFNMCTCYYFAHKRNKFFSCCCCSSSTFTSNVYTKNKHIKQSRKKNWNIFLYALWPTFIFISFTTTTLANVVYALRWWLRSWLYGKFSLSVRFDIKGFIVKEGTIKRKHHLPSKIAALSRHIPLQHSQSLTKCRWLVAKKMIIFTITF